MRDDKSIGIQSSITDVFYDYKTHIAYEMFYSDASRFNSLKIPNSIVNTIVTSASREFDFGISGDSSELLRVIKYLKDNLKIIESHLCIGGRVALKPHVNNERLSVSIYGGRDFVAYYDETGDLERVYFKSDIRESDSVSYTLVEIHSYDRASRLYRIDNQLYDSSNNDFNRKVGHFDSQIGRRVALSKCQKTAYLRDFYEIEDVDKHLCSVINLDNSMTYNKGRSIYETSINLIKDAEKIYDGLQWELEGGQIAIDADSDLFQVNPGSSLKTAKYSMPLGKERLYRKLNNTSDGFDIKVFAPSLRDENYIRGLNETLKKIENNCSLYAGALASVEHDNRTATEVMASKQRFYVLVNDIRDKMVVGIEDIIKNCCIVNNSILPYFMRENVEVSFKLGDSVLDILVDNDTTKTKEG